MYFFYAQNVTVLEKKVNELVALLDGSAEVYSSPGGVNGQVRRLGRAAFDRTVSVDSEAGHTEQETAIIFEYGCAFSRLRVRPVFIARVRPYRHLILLEIIGGVCSPFLGRIEFPTE